MSSNLERTPRPTGKQIRPRDVLVTAADTSIAVIDGASGEIVQELLLPAGRHRASFWTELLQPGQSMEVGPSVEVFQPRRGHVVTAHPLALKSDANPAFKPTSATRDARQMRIELNELKTLRQELTKASRIRRAESIDPGPVIPDAPQGDDGTVIESGPTA